ncbi:kelch repeat-containing protein [Sorangium sp. So ce1335]|uniref:Kelch repeat-containing protein n=1 Tax=Sorangium sp. So ce1335 TaxID=3133335 RepID=UPI003F5D8E21
MQDPRVLRLGSRLRTAALLSACAVLPQVLGCSDESAPRRAPPPGAASPQAAQPAARARVAALRARFAGAFGPGAAVAVARAASGALRAAAPDAAATLELPPRAAGPVRLADSASRVAIAFSLADTTDAPAAVDGDMVLYAGALRAEGGRARDVLHRVLPNGTEDFVVFDEEPERKELRYRVDVTAVSGLRLVERTLEFLDATGSPRLRVAPPYLVDATGARVPASLSVEGCAFDASPRAPWGRPVTPPGAPACTVVVAWQPAGVQYPALLDPQWVSTSNQMIAPRTRHTATVIDPTNPASPVLIAGGFSASGAALATAELYFPLDRTFASTDSMDAARGAHTATALARLPAPSPAPASPPPAVVVVGGSSNRGSGAPIAAIEVYNPATGQFVTDAESSLGRFNHTATLLDPGVILLAGGLADPLNQPTSTASVYTFSSFGPGGGAPVTSALVAVGSMATSRHAHTAVRLKSGDVLIAGGFVLSGPALASAEIFDEGTRTFQAISAVSPPGRSMSAQMGSLRGFHTATLIDRAGALIGHEATSLDSGEVVLIGGTTRVTGGAYVGTIDIYHDGVTDPTRRGFEVQRTPISMRDVRAEHTATLLPSGNILVVGGYNGTATLSTTEAYDPAARLFSRLTFASGSPAQDARREHTAVLVNAGADIDAGRAVLVAGGLGASSAQVLPSAQLLVKPNGDPCASDQECASGHCSDREHVCCNEACDEECFSCTASGKGTGNDGTCGPAKRDTELPIVCVQQIEVHNRCDGLGHAVAHESTRDCKPGRCGEDDRCVFECLDDCDCDESGWCEVGVGDLDACSRSDGAGGATAGAGGATAGAGGGGAGGDGGTAGAGGVSTGGGDASGGAAGTGGGAAGTGGGAAGTGGGAGGDGGSTGTDGGSTGTDGATAGSGGGAAAGTGASVGAGGGEGPRPGAGLCLDRLANGAECTRDRQCVSGNCVDGFCCDYRCDGPCQACDVVNNIGRCTPVGTDELREAPHPNTGGSFRREACPGEGACAGYCGGATDALCMFPVEGATARASTCTCPDGDCAVGPAMLTRFFCDGSGQEQEPEVERCGGENGGFRCKDESSCETSCDSSDDCIEDFVCLDGACADLREVGPSCDGDRTLLVVGDGDEGCAPYACPPGGKACARPCTSVSDCVDGNVCNLAGECVPPIDAPQAPSCSCSVVGGSGERDTGPLSLLLGAAVAAVRLCRRRGPRRSSRSACDPAARP